MYLANRCYPSTLTDFVGNASSVTELSRYFETYRTAQVSRGIATAGRSVVNKAGKKKGAAANTSNTNVSQPTIDNQPSAQASKLIPNIILRGPDGCGKTTLIHLLSKQYGVEILDVYKKFFAKQDSKIDQAEKKSKKKKTECTKESIHGFYTDSCYYRKDDGCVPLKLIIFEDLFKYKGQAERTIIKTLIDYNKKHKACMMIFCFDNGDKNYYKYKKLITNVVMFYKLENKDVVALMNRALNASQSSKKTECKETQKVDLEEHELLDLVESCECNIRRCYHLLADLIDRKTFLSEQTEQSDSDSTDEEEKPKKIVFQNRLSLLETCFKSYKGLSFLKNSYTMQPMIVSLIDKNYLFHIKMFNKTCKNQLAKMNLICSVSDSLAKGDVITNKSINQSGANSFQLSKLLYCVAFPSYWTAMNCSELKKDIGWRCPKIVYNVPDFVSKYHEINNTTKKVIDKYIEIASIEGFIWISYILRTLISKQDYVNVKHFCKMLAISLEDVSVLIKIDKVSEYNNIDKSTSKSLTEFLRVEREASKAIVER